ncbi:hypothetical protein V8B55DRAFT_1596608 [Mucor lusitanicus]|uniref:Uncharacterized protein n=2 Tax=Mucor circinelloides f. lusitanicus TaxID=29924 RepID=A0A168QEQ4_MUCCL|nr:hypothetical protein FB192DRAFT_1456254 [Mucor lusitanicus]OAD09135.1 hypothetical protein MUCCIDRAFT_106111 [Mucor lusitanicus CBS 277.49]
MIPTTLAILFYQVLAILGTEAVSLVVTGIAYKRRDLDYKLMYLQSPLDLFRNYHRFNQTAFQKATVFFFACLTVALKLIPTIFTKLNSSVSVYHNLSTTPLSQSVAISKYNWPSTMPVFGRFIPYLANPSATSLQDMTNAYIEFSLHQNTTQNSGGIWFTPNITKRFEWDNQQRAFSDGFRGSPSLGSYTIFPFSRQGTSSTMERCSTNTTSLVKNLPRIHGNLVKGSRSYSLGCYPTYDSSIPILHRFDNKDNFQLPSLLDANDTIYRFPKPSGSVSASSSFGVSIFNHNTTHMTMGIKKTAHITFYNRLKNATFPSDCSIGSRANFTNNFKDLPYDAVLCELRNVVHDSSDMVVSQAAGRSFQENYALSTVYTFRRNIGANVQGEIVMIDFALFQAFNVEGNLLDNKEHMVAYSRNSLLQGSPPDIDASTDLSNDAIGSLLRELDPSDLNQETADILVGMASMRVRWENGDFSDFALNQAEVTNAINTPLWWIATVSALVILFLIPHASRFVVRRIPEYTENLRNLLLITIERSDALENTSKVKNVGLFLTDQRNETDRMALLSVNGHPITIAGRLTSPDTSLFDERIGGIDEKLMYSG